jgi:hypothetical protein
MGPPPQLLLMLRRSEAAKLLLMRLLHGSTVINFTHGAVVGCMVLWVLRRWGLPGAGALRQQLGLHHVHSLPQSVPAPSHTGSQLVSDQFQKGQFLSLLRSPFRKKRVSSSAAPLTLPAADQPALAAAQNEQEPEQPEVPEMQEVPQPRPGSQWQLSVIDFGRASKRCGGTVVCRGHLMLKNATYASKLACTVRLVPPQVSRPPPLRFRHPNVVRVYGSDAVPGYQAAIMERCVASLEVRRPGLVPTRRPEQARDLVPNRCVRNAERCWPHPARVLADGRGLARRPDGGRARSDPRRRARPRFV